MLFQLYGRIGWSVGSCHDSRTMRIDERFEIPDGPDTEVKAIEKAREIVKNLHKEHSHLVDYTLVAGLRVIKEIWETHFEEGRPGVPAQPARPAVVDHLEEKILV
jgi:hypothetical protein